MGVCAKKSKQVIKWAAKLIGPQLLASAGRAVGAIEEMSAEDPEWWTSAKKRDAAEAYVRIEGRLLKRSVPTHLILLAIEQAVAMLKMPDASIKPEDLGDATDEDIESA